MTPGIRRLYAPRRVEVGVDSKGVPRSVEGIAVDAVREEWVVADRWWTSQPLRRHYFDLVPAGASALPCVRSAPPRGADSLLKVLPVDAASRVPERRAMLTPYPVPGR